MKILVLREQEMKQVLGMGEAIEAAREALTLYSAGQCEIPLRTNFSVTQYAGQSLFMPGYVPKADAMGVKIVSVYPNNPAKGYPGVPAAMVLVDPETGQVSALMDGTYLTRLRTGAVAGAAADLLAGPACPVFALFGTGGQAETQLEGVLSVRRIDLVKVYGRNADHREKFVRRMNELYAERYHVRIEAAASAKEAVQDADIITAVTTSRTPVFDGTMVKAGAHINGVGSFTPFMAEVDTVTLNRAGKIYCDTRDALLEAGDFTQAVEKGAFRLDQVTGELGEAFLGRVPGRESAREITFFKTTGSAVLDVVTAQKILRSAAEQGIGTCLEF